MDRRRAEGFQFSTYEWAAFGASLYFYNCGDVEIATGQGIPTMTAKAWVSIRFDFFFFFFFLIQSLVVSTVGRLETTNRPGVALRSWDQRLAFRYQIISPLAGYIGLGNLRDIEPQLRVNFRSDFNLSSWFTDFHEEDPSSAIILGD